MKYKREALEEGLPLIRPLWLVAGGDPTLVVNDEFVLGDEIVVAPVLNQGQTTREGKCYNKINVTKISQSQSPNREREIKFV